MYICTYSSLLIQQGVSRTCLRICMYVCIIRMCACTYMYLYVHMYIYLRDVAQQTMDTELCVHFHGYVCMLL